MKLQSTADDIVLSESFGFTGGFNAVGQLMKQVKSRPEVILAASDDIALGVIKGLTSMGIKIPEDIQVIGFTDGVISRHAMPGLTTVSQHAFQMGAKAAELLIEKIENEDFSEVHQTVIIETELIERESTL